MQFIENGLCVPRLQYGIQVFSVKQDESSSTPHSSIGEVALVVDADDEPVGIRVSLTDPGFDIDERTVL